MQNKTGKLFQDNQTRKVTAYEYIEKNEYYPFVEAIQRQGMNQCIITSDIMLKFMEYFLYKYNAKITAIEFMIEDDILQEEINEILKRMDVQPAFWEKLKQKLHFLSEENCIDLKSILIKCQDENFILRILVNGLFTVTDSSYDAVAKELSSLMEVLIK